MNARTRPHRIQNSPSVRAGTNQAKLGAGARGDSAARCTNCHVSTQPRGCSTKSAGIALATSGPFAGMEGAHIEKTQTVKSGNGADRAFPIRWTPPFSTVLQLSMSPSAAEVWSESKANSASNPQCCVASSQKAATKTTKNFRKRLTVAGKLVRCQMSTITKNRGASDHDWKSEHRRTRLEAKGQHRARNWLLLKRSESRAPRSGNASSETTFP